jgi:transcriptional regulator with XRE-family HTH domain
LDLLDVSRTASVGDNIRQLRSTRGLTLDRLAALSQLTRGYISLVERGLKVPSIAALTRMALALEVTVADFFDASSASAPRYTVFRRDGHPGSSSGKDGFELMAIAAGRKRKLMEPFLLSPPLTSAPLVSHPGEEMLFVVSGKIAITVNGEELTLSKGDCIYFAGESQHEVRSVGRQKAQVLLVLAQGPSPVK